jgi:hypothetical protein
MDLNKILIQLQEMQNQLWGIIKFHKENPASRTSRFFTTQKPDAHLLVLLQHYQSLCNTIDDVKSLMIEQKTTAEFRR